MVKKLSVIIQNKEYLIQLKHSRGCCKCNYKNADQLCFHHRYIFQEHKNINDLLNKTEALMKELENCDIYCRQCFGQHVVKERKDLRKRAHFLSC